MNGSVYKANRRALMERVNSIAVITAYTKQQRSNDAAYSLDQEANFYWLTGITAADWQVIITPEYSWLVSPDISDVHQVFDGSLSHEDALLLSGADAVLTYKEANSKLNDLAKTYGSVATVGAHPYKSHYDFSENPAERKLRTRLKKQFGTVTDCRVELAKLRAIKQPYEIDAIRRAISVTNQAFELVKKKISAGELKTEYEIEAEFTYHFKRTANADHAYDPIVAFGKNACTLHYNHNANQLGRGLVLLDIGARVDGYAADITRTYSVGEPTERERAVHAAVQHAQSEIIALLAPGVSVKTYSEKVDEIMRSALKQLGLYGDPSDYRKYFPHAVSHGLGIDVHDSLGGPEVFSPGMVLTVEPGIYIPEEGIGVRIEDDILITETGHENLSVQLSTNL